MIESAREAYREDAEIRPEVDRLARMFKVSTLVILRRIHDAGGITRDQLRSVYGEELDRLRAVPRGSGGDFYLTQAARVGKRFARHVLQVARLLPRAARLGPRAHAGDA